MLIFRILYDHFRVNSLKVQFIILFLQNLKDLVDERDELKIKLDVEIQEHKKTIEQNSSQFDILINKVINDTLVLSIKYST